MCYHCFKKFLNVPHWKRINDFVDWHQPNNRKFEKRNQNNVIQVMKDFHVCWIMFLCLLSKGLGLIKNRILISRLDYSFKICFFGNILMSIVIPCINGVRFREMMSWWVLLVHEAGAFLNISFELQLVKSSDLAK